jgi:hypothetical protein
MAADPTSARRGADPIARLFLASKATLTFLPNIHTDEETFYFIANIVLRDDQDVHVAETDGEITGFLAIHGDWWSISTSVRISCAGASVVRCSSEPRSGCRWGSGGGSSWRTFRRGASTERHGLRLVEETDGSRNEERTPDASTSGGPPTRKSWSQDGGGMAG